MRMLVRALSPAWHRSCNVSAQILWLGLASIAIATNSYGQGFPNISQPNPGTVLATIDGTTFNGGRASLLSMHCDYLLVADQDRKMVTRWNIGNLQNITRVQTWANIGNSHAYGQYGNAFFMNSTKAFRPTATSFELFDPVQLGGEKGYFDPFFINSRSGYQNLNGFQYLLQRRATGNHGALSVPISLAQASNVVGRTYIIGNLLIIAGVHNLSGVATFDISNPASPQPLDFLPNIGGYEPAVYEHYLIFMNGNNGDVAGAGRNGYIVDFADPRNLRLVRSFNAGQFPGNTRYIQFQDQKMFVGRTKVNIETFINVPTSTPAQVIERTFNGSGLTLDRIDYLLPMGNLVALAHYDDGGFRICAHQTAPDTTGPQVAYHLPATNEVNVPRTSRIGLVIHETLDPRTITVGTTLIVRPLGGASMPGDWALIDHDVLNFAPHNDFAANTVYEVFLPAGGIKDVAGNGMQEYRFQFSTGPTIAANPPTIASFNLVTHPARPGQIASFTASATDPDGGVLTYRFNPGDGTPGDNGTGYRPASTAFNYTYAVTGRYTASLRVTDNTGRTDTDSFTVTVIDPPTATPASTLPIHLANRRIWTANPDSNTVTSINADTRVKVVEIAVGAGPRTLCAAPDGRIWVACQDADRVDIVNPGTNTVVESIQFPYGSMPYGILMALDGANAYVSLEGAGSIARIDTATRMIAATLPVGPKPRAMARRGNLLLATRFISPVDRAELYDINLATFTLAAVRPLAIDTTTEDTAASSRGVLNYLAGISISPDGNEAWIACKKDNTLRGTFRDGRPLTFENTVRTMLVRFNLTSKTETAARIDIDNNDSASSVVFSPLGDYVFATIQGNNHVAIIDVLQNRFVGHIGSEEAPNGAAMDPVTNVLFVSNFLGRSVTPFNVDQFLKRGDIALPSFARISTVQTEPLPANVLAGKRIFYNSEDPRMSRDSYISCATCHLDGGSDGRVWDFTDRGEGFRRTTDLRGRRGMAHGFVHWSANFDEIQDFEHDIRNAFGGEGFMSDADFNTGTRNQTLGLPKAGVSPELDQLAAYVASLDSTPPSFSRTGGVSTASGLRGRRLFMQLACATCHGGDDFTDSAMGARHNVGTIRASSGERMGGPLLGIDTPTLRGLAHASSYLHHGFAPTLADVFTAANAPVGTPHALVRNLTAAEQTDIRQFLLELDDQEPAAPPAGSQIGGGILREYWTGIAGSAITDLQSSSAYPDAATGRDTLSEFQSVNWADPADASGWADSYGERIRGFVHPPTTGNYTFFISGDDYCDLYLGTSDAPASAVKIASVPGFSGFQTWTKYPQQRSVVIPLVAGQRYYIEALHKEGTGGDHVSVGWLKPGQTGTIPSEIIPGACLSPFDSTLWMDVAIGANAGGSLIASGDLFTMENHGGDIWNLADDFHYAHQRATGDFTMTARVESIENTHVWAKAGVMIRENLTPSSRHVSMFATVANGVALQRRLTANATSVGTTIPGIAAPVWVRLVRSGSTITGSYSTDGVNWTTVGSETLSLAAEVYVGFAYTSRNPVINGEAHFDRVSLQH